VPSTYHLLPFLSPELTPVKASLFVLVHVILDLLPSCRRVALGLLREDASICHLGRRMTQSLMMMMNPGMLAPAGNALACKMYLLLTFAHDQSVPSASRNLISQTRILSHAPAATKYGTLYSQHTLTPYSLPGYSIICPVFHKQN